MASVTVDVEIDEFDDAEVLCAALERGYRLVIPTEKLDKFDKWEREQIKKAGADEFKERADTDELDELASLLREGRYGEAVDLVEAMRRPKFKTLAECIDKYTKTKEAAAS